MTETKIILWQSIPDGFAFNLMAQTSQGLEPVTFPLAVGQQEGQRIPKQIEDVCAILEDLILDGQANLEERKCLLPHTAIYDLDETTRNKLELPQISMDLRSSIRTQGVIANPAFQIVLEVRHPVHGRLEGFITRHENVYHLFSGEILVVPRELYELMHVIDLGPPTSISDLRIARLTYQERVKRKAIIAGVKLESFMETESYILPEDNSLTANIQKESDEHIVLTPEFSSQKDTDSIALKEINDKLKREACDNAVLSVPSSSGGRVRVIFDDQTKNIIGELKANTHLRGIDVPRFLDNPEAYLPEGLNLEDFSDRVTGIAIERVTVRPRIELFRRGGELIEFDTKLSVQPIGFQSGIGFDNPEMFTREDLDELIRKTKDAGEEYIYFRNKWVHVDVASLEEFKRALEKVNEKYGDKHLSKNELQGFLEIFTNIDDLEYGDALILIKDILREQEKSKEARYPIPDTLQTSLYPYQQRGYIWLRFLDEQHWGGLLADDMGLGKTVQAIALLAALGEQREVSPSLIVVPKSIITNWENELRGLCPSLRVYSHTGSNRIRGIEKMETFARSIDVLITTYQTMRRDQLALGRINWKAIILDEAQNIKNPNTGVSTASKAFKAIRIRVALTGTPVENGLSELWSIFDFVQPGHLGSYRDFRKTYEIPLQGDGEVAERTSLALRHRIKDLYLRRLKEEVLEDLPKRAIYYERVKFSEQQLQLYLNLIEQGKNAGRGEMLGILHGLVKVCSHPAMVKKDASQPNTRELITACPKFARTFEILDRIQERGERVLIFTEYKEMQTLLMSAIRDHYGVQVARINGDIATRERQLLIDHLNSTDSFGVLVLSPTAGGVGLNIAGANHVIHYTRVWNPAKEAQAIGRVHRIGQKRPVSIYYPIVQHEQFETIEVRIDSLLRRKAKLARDVIQPSEGLNITQEELQDLLGERA